MGIAPYGAPASTPCKPLVPPITVGAVAGVVALCKNIADGAAKPDSVETYEAISADSGGIVLLFDKPVDFHPEHKIANAVHLEPFGV